MSSIILMRGTWHRRQPGGTIDARTRQSNRFWQIVNSFIPFVAVWYLAYRALAVSYWLTLALAALGAGFMVRLFIIQHDCGHGSFFKSKNANDVVGSVLGVLTLTPYFYWRQQLLHKAVLTFWLSLKCIFLNLWDEEQQKLLSFRALRAMPTAG